MLRYFFIGFSLLVLLIVSMTGLRGWKSKLPPVELFPDMVRQPKYKAQTESDFYGDGRSARSHVVGTVPIGYAMPQEKSESLPAAKSARLLSKLADADEVQGVDGAQELSVYNILDAPSTGATQQFAASVEFRKKSIENLGPYNNIQFSGSSAYAATGRMGTQWGTGIPFEVTPAIMERGRQRYTINCAVCHGATGLGNGITSKYGLNSIANLHQQRIRDMADGEIFNTITWGKNTMMGYGSNIQVPDRWAIICYLRALQRSQNGTIVDVPEADKKKFTGMAEKE